MFLELFYPKSMFWSFSHQKLTEPVQRHLIYPFLRTDNCSANAIHFLIRITYWHTNSEEWINPFPFYSKIISGGPGFSWTYSAYRPYLIIN